MKVSEFEVKEFIVEELPACTIDGEVVSTMYYKQKELIRCKDCKHWYNGCCYSNVSNRINFTVEVPDDWFCADGRKKE